LHGCDPEFAGLGFKDVRVGDHAFFAAGAVTALARYVAERNASRVFGTIMSTTSYYNRFKAGQPEHSPQTAEHHPDQRVQSTISQSRKRDLGGQRARRGRSQDD